MKAAEAKESFKIRKICLALKTGKDLKEKSWHCQYEQSKAVRMMKIGKVPSTLVNIDEEPRLLGTNPWQAL